MRAAGLRLGEGLRRAGERAARAIEAAPVAVALLSAALFLAAGIAGASLKEMWYDEVHTYALTRLGSLERIQAALDAGADGNRAGFYAATLASARLFGLGPTSIRLPAVVGFLAFAAALGVFAARRCGAGAGWVAAAIPFLTGARLYAFEGRQYGLVLGLTGAALLGWQAAADGRRGGRALLALALVGGSLVSPLMAFTVLALAAGEAWRTAARRRVDWLVGSAFVLAGGVLLLSQRAAAPGFSRIAACGGQAIDLPAVPAVLETYGWLVGAWPFPTKVAIALAAWAAWQALAARAAQGAGPAAPRRAARLLPHETAAAIGFVLMPPVVFAATRLSRFPYFPRYSIAATAGVALVAAALFRRLRADGRGGRAAALLVAIAFWAHAGSVALQRTGPSGPAGLDAVAALAGPDERPIVVASPFDYAKYTFYARPELQARMRMLYEPDALGPGFAGAGDLACLFGLQPYWPVRLEAYREFLRTGGPFVLVAPTGDTEGVGARLAADGYRLELRGRAGANDVLAVEPGPPPAAAPAEEPTAKSTYPP